MTETALVDALINRGAHSYSPLSTGVTCQLQNIAIDGIGETEKVLLRSFDDQMKSLRRNDVLDTNPTTLILGLCLRRLSLFWGTRASKCRRALGGSLLPSAGISAGSDDATQSL